MAVTGSLRGRRDTGGVGAGRGEFLKPGDEVRIEIVWDPVWTRKMIREEARETMRGLGIVA